MKYTNSKTILANMDSAVRAVKENNFIVASFDGTNFSTSSNPVTHGTIHEARNECRRLATNNPGKLFIPVQLKGGEFVPVVNRMSI